MRVKQAIRFIYSAKAENQRVLIRFFFEMRVESGRASTYCGRKRKRSLSHTELGRGNPVAVDPPFKSELLADSAYAAVPVMVRALIDCSGPSAL